MKGLFGFFAPAGTAAFGMLPHVILYMAGIDKLHMDVAVQ
jgi:hypothetical protein